MEASTRELIQRLQEILTIVQQNVDQDDFNKKPGKYLGAAINIYAEFLKHNKLSSFNEFMEKITVEGKTNFGLQGVIEELWELEETWDNVLKMTIAKKVFIRILIM